MFFVSSVPVRNSWLINLIVDVGGNCTGVLLASALDYKKGSLWVLSRMTAWTDAILRGALATRIGTDEVNGRLKPFWQSRRGRVGDWDEWFFLYSEEIAYLRRVRESSLFVRMLRKRKAFTSEENIWEILSVNVGATRSTVTGCVPAEHHCERNTAGRCRTGAQSRVALTLLKDTAAPSLRSNELRPHEQHSDSTERQPIFRGALVSNVGVALALAVVLCPSVAFADVILREVDGGPKYYSRFSNPLPSDPNFFPLGVWLESVVDSNADLEKDAGLNLYVVLTPDSSLSLVQNNGMRAILQQSEWRSSQTAINSPAVAGWELFDEVDMQQGPGHGYTTLNNILAQLPNDRRMRYNNYGKGVMFWEADAQAERFVNDFQDVVSADIYWFTDPNVSGSSEGGKLLNRSHPLTPTQTRRAANYGYTVDRMRALNAKDGLRKPIWNFVEVGWPFSESAAQNGRAILPAEVRAAVWHSIIAGARGIIYFNHSFGGPHISQHCLREPAYALVRTSVKSTNELITQLAPVLNAPFADGFVKASESVRTMAKFYDNKYYVFAGSKENVASTPTFSLSGVNSGTATVVGENRTIPISTGQFSDSFADGNVIHIYRIDSN